MYYVEFFTKKPDVSWEQFERVVKVAFRRWADHHPEDAPVLAIGRTWRLGPPTASYMIVWRIPNFARLDEWTEARRNDLESAQAISEGTLSVADMDAGVYDEVENVML
jgi:hypothetical protein